MALFVLCAAPHVVEASPKIHVVYKGQRLGSIAKRYNVTIEELCRANDISRRDPIHPGQKLVIPGKSAPAKASPKKDPVRKEPQAQKVRPPKDPGPNKIHVVYKGQRLGSIAKRYNVSVAALAHANSLRVSNPIQPGQRLVIPHQDDKDGSEARRAREKLIQPEPKRVAQKRAPRVTRSWLRYKKPAWKRGYVHLVGYNKTWKGYVIGPRNQVLGAARRKISGVLGAPKGTPIHSRLVRLIATVSDTFGGRKLRIVSGYREFSYSAASKHKVGRALDFSIPGVPNEALRDYLRATFKNIGVGYYPNSTFVHLDVRTYNAYWIDDSGPGEPPRYRHLQAQSKQAPTKNAGSTPTEAVAARGD